MMKTILMTVACLLFSTNIMAAGYFKGGLGMSFGGEMGIDSTNVDVDLDSGFFFGGAYGMHLSDMLAVEVEITHRMNDLDDSVLETTMTNLAFNGVFNFPIGGPVAPYFGGGLTLGTYGLEAGSYDESGFGFGLQFFGGASFKVQENIFIGADLRYLITLSDVEIDDVDFDFSHLGLLGNVRFHF